MEVRRFTAGSGPRLREVRLRALRDAPFAFSSRYARGLAHQPEFWEARTTEGGVGSEWARTAGALSLRLAVTGCAEAQPAARLYRGLGFEPTGQEESLGCNPELSVHFMQREL
jgi:hypothetical protein